MYPQDAIEFDIENEDAYDDNRIVDIEENDDDDSWADANSLASIGWGMDEDYNHYEY